jgi:hypothetical protein
MVRYSGSDWHSQPQPAPSAHMRGPMGRESYRIWAAPWGRYLEMPIAARGLGRWAVRGADGPLLF